MKYFLKRSARPRKTGLLARKRESCELGPKADFFNERLNASAAYFEIHENNRSVSDDDYNNQTPTHYAFKGTKAVTKVMNWKWPAHWRRLAAAGRLYPQDRA